MSIDGVLFSSAQTSSFQWHPHFKQENVMFFVSMRVMSSDHSCDCISNHVNGYWDV